MPFEMKGWRLVLLSLFSFPFFVIITLYGDLRSHITWYPPPPPFVWCWYNADPHEFNHVKTPYTYIVPSLSAPSNNVGSSASTDRPSPSLLHQFQYCHEDGTEYTSSSSNHASSSSNHVSQKTSSASPINSGGGNKHGTSSGNGGEADSDVKRAERLARNRESARQSRLRKKEFLGQLQEKVSLFYHQT